MLYDDFQNENSHYNCKGSVFRQNDIIIFRQNDIKTKKTGYYVFDRMTSRQIAFSFFSLMIRDISELMHKQVA